MIESNEQYILEMKGFKKDFAGIHSLNGASISVRAGSIHALLGENGAGKSTLMRCLFGLCRQDEGEVFIEGKKIQISSPQQANENGIAMAHQESTEIANMTVFDNIWMGSYYGGNFFITQKKLYQKTKEILASMDIKIQAEQIMGSLTIAQKQMVSIARAISHDAKIIVLDDPTSSLAEQDAINLFEIIRVLKEQGKTFIYSTHKINEVFNIADEVTILRDGRWITTEPVEKMTEAKIIKLMVGREMTHRFPLKTNEPGEIVLRVKGLTGAIQPSIKDVTFDLREGEILGVAGLIGARRTELLQSLFGIDQLSEGFINLNGKRIRNKTPRESIKNGFAMIPEVRSQSGIFSELSVEYNTTISNLRNYSNHGFLRINKVRSDAKRILNALSVNVPTLSVPVRELNGACQQKIVFARWLLTDAQVFLIDEPTQGVESSAKFEIYKLIIDLAYTGKSIIMVSSEMTELLGLTDRILVMSNGRIAGIEDTSKMNQERILSLASMYF